MGCTPIVADDEKMDVEPNRYQNAVCRISLIYPSSIDEVRLSFDKYNDVKKRLDVTERLFFLDHRNIYGRMSGLSAKWN